MKSHSKPDDQTANQPATKASQDEVEIAAIMDLVKERNNLEEQERMIDKQYLHDSVKIASSPEFAVLNQKKKEFHDKYVLNPKEMRLIIEDKSARKYPGRSLNCTVFENMASPELKSYLTDLFNNNALVNQRFQIVIQSSVPRGLSHHWSAADIVIHENEIQVFHFDSVSSPVSPTQGGLNGNELEEVLNSVSPPKPIKMIDAYTKINDSIYDLQTDSDSCSIFALSSALAMSRIPDLHEIAKNKSAPASNKAANKSAKNIARYFIDTTNLPAMLLKNVQSYTVIGNYEAAHQNDNLNNIQKRNGVKTLSQFAETRSIVQPSSNNEKAPRKQNYGVLFTRAKYKKITKKAQEKTENKKGIK